MPLKGFAVKAESETTTLIVATFLVANAFVWYLSAFDFLHADFSGKSFLIVISVGIACLVASAFSVTVSMKRFSQRLAFLKYWMLGGFLFSVALAFPNFANLPSAVAASAILGVYFGVGMPICMGYFSATTKPEIRAKTGAVIILAIGLGFPFLSSIGSSQLLFAGALAIWRLSAFAAPFIFRPEEKTAEAKQTVSYRSVFANRTFLLYLVPWFMFELINELANEINKGYFASLPKVFFHNYMVVEIILSGISAVACGFLADRKGRKRVALFGFALLGLGYAALGISSSINSSLAVYSAAWFYVAADGTAWGAFAMLFLVTIWGDIARERNSEKFYFIGVLPYLISNLAGQMMGPLISAGILESTVFSFASFFLFIAILPLAYAPETLPEKIMIKLDMDDYVAKALGKVKKEPSKKPLREVDDEAEEENCQAVVADPSVEDGEAEKLAEKYYY